MYVVVGSVGYDDDDDDVDRSTCHGRRESRRHDDDGDGSSRRRLCRPTNVFVDCRAMATRHLDDDDCYKNLAQNGVK